VLVSLHVGDEDEHEPRTRVTILLKIRVTVKPQSKRRELKRIADGEYTASVQAPARGGKANQALIELLSESFSVPKNSIKILIGGTSKKKLVEIG
jgi:hypothetical protein